MLIFLFVCVAIFGVLFATIPSAFFATSHEARVGSDKAVAETLSLANLTVYDNLGSDNMTYSYRSFTDHPSAPQFPTGVTDEYLDIWWGADSAVRIQSRSLQFRRTYKVWWWWGFERLEVSYGNGTGSYPVILDYHLTQAWDNEVNASTFYGTSSHVLASIAFTYNQTKYSSISDAYWSGELSYDLSHEVNWNATNVNAFTILGQLLTFQNPNLGITGTGGTILNILIASPFWVMTAILIIKLIQSIIPFIRGVDE